MTAKGWQTKTIDDLCEFSNGHGFGPRDWAEAGIPIIRIQNLNGETDFNYFQGKPEPEWLVEPGTILFAWAGTRGVSFGPTIWNGPQGVLNQHIFRVQSRQGVERKWLYLALRGATDRIERKAHGFKSTLLHVGKKDITRQLIQVPPLPEQRKISDILATWDMALEKLDSLIVAKERCKKALLHQLLTGEKRLKGCAVKISMKHASELFANRSERNTSRLPVLSVTQDQGVVLRSGMERKITHDQGNTHTYKVVNEGDYVISLRSFQGGLEYSAHNGAVSPAYHVIYPIVQIAPSFYRHYFKSVDFIGRLATAVIGIRDGKQVNYQDFGFLKLPYPDIETQKSIGAILDNCEEELRLLRAKRDALDQQKRGLMQRLLTGRVRVKRCELR